MMQELLCTTPVMRAECRALGMISEYYTSCSTSTGYVDLALDEPISFVRESEDKGGGS